MRAEAEKNHELVWTRYLLGIVHLARADPKRAESEFSLALSLLRKGANGGGKGSKSSSRPVAAGRGVGQSSRSTSNATEAQTPENPEQTRRDRERERARELEMKIKLLSGLQSAASAQGKTADAARYAKWRIEAEASQESEQEGVDIHRRG